MKMSQSISTSNRLAWGAKVSGEFSRAAVGVARRIGVPPSDLMACMAWESGETFSPSIRNGAGSGATGLIQFMPQTAASLGTTTDKLAAMTAVQQLVYVERYFKPWRGKLRDLGDLYMAILWPAGIGKPMDHILFRRDDPHRPKLYLQNKGLDIDRDGDVDKAECCTKVLDKRSKGLRPGYFLDLPE